MSVEVTEADRKRVREAAYSLDDDRLAEGYFGQLLAQHFAAHRHQAEEAMQERAAAYVEGKGGVIPGATVFISLITGDRMPCMSGDGRDKLNPHKRRQFDDATRDLAAAIRSIDTRGE